jgi:hypothetical protein
MSAPETPVDLLDLKLMPAWVNETAGPNEYAEHTGEDDRPLFERRGPRPERGRDGRPGGRKPGGDRDARRDGGPRRDSGPRRENRGPRDDRRPQGGARPERGPRRDDRPPREAVPLPQVAVRFLPHPPAFENVIAQIKSGALAYSVFALARLFLDKPERYIVRLTAAEGVSLFQLGEKGAVAADRRILEANAFAAMKEEFYAVEITQTEPLKGNFSNVARDRISGTLLGPTNHHSYQPQLRSLYEQRYSRRMSFQDFQRQIEIVSDPAVVEQWKEQARSITTYTTTKEETPITFNSAAEAERHFRQTYLPTLLREAQEMTISGVLSRALPDRGLGRVIEDAWAAEIRSPSKMMQELAGGLRQAGLNIFRHRRGMLYVSPIRTRQFGHERGSVSVTVNAILEKLGETPALNRKQLLEKSTPEGADDLEIGRVKMTLASDLRWLISEGYLIEFNDGTLDLPRAKAPAPAQPQKSAGDKSAAAEQPASEQSSMEQAPHTSAEPAVAPEPDMAPVIDEGVVATGDDVGGMAVEQSIEPSAVEEPTPVEPTVAPHAQSEEQPAEVSAVDRAEQP